MPSKSVKTSNSSSPAMSFSELMESGPRRSRSSGKSGKGGKGRKGAMIEEARREIYGEFEEQWRQRENQLRQEMDAHLQFVQQQGYEQQQQLQQGYDQQQQLQQQVYDQQMRHQQELQQAQNVTPSMMTNLAGSRFKPKVPELGSASMGSLTLPTEREYLVWKEKTHQYHRMVGLPQQLVMDQLIMHMYGRVAEYVLLSVPKEELLDGNAIYNVMRRLDDLILGDLANVVSNAVQRLNSCKRGSRPMDDYVLDYQLQFEKVTSLGKGVDAEYAGSMLLDHANVTMVERQLVLATTGRSLEFHKVANALRQLFAKMSTPSMMKETALISEDPMGLDIQEGLLSYDNKTRRMNPPPPADSKSKFATFHCYSCHQTGHIANRCRNPPVDSCPDGRAECRAYRDNKNKNKASRAMLAGEEEITFAVEEVFSVREEAVWVESVSGILDTACTRTVVGQEWLEEFITVTDRPLEYVESDRRFRGIGGVITTSNRMVKIKCLVFGKPMTLEANVIPGKTPLLISKASMAKLGIILDTRRNRIQIEVLDGPGKDWREVPSAQSGHLLLPIDDLCLEENLEEVLAVFPNDKPRMPEWRCKNAIGKALRKLHLQFRHAPVSNIVAMVKASKADVDYKLLEEAASDFVCDHCVRFETRRPSPVVKMPREPMFNQEVAADVFYFLGEPILHVLCTFTAYCQAVVLVSVTGAAVVRALVDHWIRYFGRPAVLFCDLGSEFANGEVRSLADSYGMEVKHTAGQAHWSGGRVESKHGPLRRMLSATVSESGESAEFCLPSVVMARNSMTLVHGYSPEMLALGRNLHGELSSSDAPTTMGTCRSTAYSGYVARFLYSTQMAREAYHAAEAKTRLQVALNSRVRAEGIMVILVTGSTTGPSLNIKGRRRGTAQVSSVLKILVGFC